MVQQRYTVTWTTDVEQRPFVDVGSLWILLYMRFVLPATEMIQGHQTDAMPGSTLGCVLFPNSLELELSELITFKQLQFGSGTVLTGSSNSFNEAVATGTPTLP